MVNFELSKETKKDVVYLIMSVRQRKHSESPAVEHQSMESKGLRFDSSVPHL